MAEHPPRFVKMIKIGRDKAMIAEILVAKVFGTTEWFNNSKYAALLTEVKNYLYVELKDGSLEKGKTHKMESASENLRMTVEVRAARDKLVVLDCPRELISKNFGTERQSKKCSGLTRTQNHALRIRVEPYQSMLSLLANDTDVNPPSNAVEGPDCKRMKKQVSIEFVPSKSKIDSQDGLNTSAVAHADVNEFPERKAGDSMIFSDVKDSANANRGIDVKEANPTHILRLKVSSIDDTELQNQVGRLEEDLWNIFKGKIESQRHQMYRQKGSTRAHLPALVFCGPFSHHQQDLVLACLVKIFCGKKGEKYMKYVSDVLFPETLIRITANLGSISREESESFLERSASTS